LPRPGTGPGPGTGILPARINDVPVATFPEDARRIALARMDLITQWESFRTRFDSLAQGDDEFTRWYQTGHGAPHLHTVPAVSVGSLSLEKDLGGSTDWRNLVPRPWSGMVCRPRSIRRPAHLRTLLDPRRSKISQ
jgi:hypothetical protein